MAKNREELITLEEELERLMDELRDALAKGRATKEIEQRINEIKRELL